MTRPDQTRGAADVLEQRALPDAGFPAHDGAPLRPARAPASSCSTNSRSVRRPTRSTSAPRPSPAGPVVASVGTLSRSAALAGPGTAR